MSRLRHAIADAIEAGRVVIGIHADERVEERGVTAWQVVGGFSEAIVLEERPVAKPNPTLRVRQTLPDGGEAEIVWSYLRKTGRAKLVTVYLP